MLGEGEGDLAESEEAREVAAVERVSSGVVEAVSSEAVADSGEEAGRFACDGSIVKRGLGARVDGAGGEECSQALVNVLREVGEVTERVSSLRLVVR